jgi:hypothetical protein
LNEADQIIKDMEARGEIPPPGSLPAGQISVIVHRIISPPNGEQNWERYITSRTNSKTESSKDPVGVPGAGAGGRQSVW